MGCDDDGGSNKSPFGDEKSKKDWIWIHGIDGVVNGRTRFGVKIATVPQQWHQKACWRLLASHQVYIPNNGARKLIDAY
jgi:hypothetical protein